MSGVIKLSISLIIVVAITFMVRAFLNVTNFTWLVDNKLSSSIRESIFEFALINIATIVIEYSISLSKAVEPVAIIDVSICHGGFSLTLSLIQVIKATIVVGNLTLHIQICLITIGVHGTSIAKLRVGERIVEVSLPRLDGSTLD